MYDLTTIIPQSAPMRLIDTLESVNQDQALCKATITHEHIFYDQSIAGVYAWVGIEMMAQAAAALAYFQGEKEHHGPRRGFMISVRNFTTRHASFNNGDVLSIIANKELISDPLGVFLCEIHREGELISSAKFSAYQPNQQEFIEIMQGKTF